MMRRANLSGSKMTISFNPASAAAKQARGKPLGSVLEQFGKP
jgi:hypothetical protein